MGRIKEVHGRLLLLLAALTGAFAAFVGATGGVDTRVAGIAIRSRSWERPGLVAAMLAIAAILVLRRSMWRAVQHAFVLSPWVAAAWALSAGLAYGAFAAGGADSYGYVSQAELLARGQLTERLPPMDGFRWPDVAMTLTPLAYRAGTTPETLSPIYPPGLPLMMAPLAAIDARAVFLLVPCCAAAAVLLTWRLGRVLDGNLTGRLAAILLAVSPTFVTQTVQPMSDVPVTACWMAALLLARQAHVTSALASGAVASLAILIRPNLAPLAALVAVAAAMRDGGFDRRRTIVCIVSMLPGLASLAAIQQIRYGSPLGSGYGSFSELFSAGNITFNLARYPRWLTETHSPFIWLWIAAPAWIHTRDRIVRPLAWIVYAFCWAGLMAYLPYSYFREEEWFYTRFLLPAIPMMLILGAATMASVARRFGPRAGPALIVLSTTALAIWLAVTTRSVGAFTLHDQERKFPEAGRFVRDRLPPGAVVIAMQHSGSIRYYADRLTVRWDLLDPAWLDRAVVSLRAAGREPFAVLDLEEEPAFRARFAATHQRALERLTPIGRVGPTRIYAIEPPADEP